MLGHRAGTCEPVREAALTEARPVRIWLPVKLVPEKAEQEVFGADPVVSEQRGLPLALFEAPFSPRGDRAVALRNPR